VPVCVQGRSDSGGSEPPSGSLPQLVTTVDEHEGTRGGSSPAAAANKAPGWGDQGGPSHPHAMGKGSAPNGLLDAEEAIHGLPVPKRPAALAAALPGMPSLSLHSGCGCGSHLSCKGLVLV
jgi:hypothetical protein